MIYRFWAKILARSSSSGRRAVTRSVTLQFGPFFWAALFSLVAAGGRRYLASPFLRLLFHKSVIRCIHAVRCAVALMKRCIMVPLHAPCPGAKARSCHGGGYDYQRTRAKETILHAVRGSGAGGKAVTVHRPHRAELPGGGGDMRGTTFRGDPSAQNLYTLPRETSHELKRK